MPPSENLSTQPWDSLNSPPHLLFDPGLPDRDVLRTPPWSPTVNTEWDTLVSGIELVERTTRKTLTDLIAMIPESVQKTIRSVKDRYAYREYSIDGRRCQYMGMKAEWNEETGEISNITLRLKSGTREYTPQLASSNTGEYTLYTTRGQDIVSIKELVDPMTPIQLLTSLWLDQVDRMAPRKPRKTISKFRTRVGKDHQTALSLGVPDSAINNWNQPITFEEWMEESVKAEILRTFAPFLDPKKISIPKAPDSEAYAINKVQWYKIKLKGNSYAAVVRLSLKDESKRIEIYRREDGRYYINVDDEKNRGTELGSFYYGEWSGREGKYIYDNASWKISIEATSMQRWLDTLGKKHGITRNMQQWENTGKFPLSWKNMPITYQQASVIIAFEWTQYDFWDGLNGKLEILPDIESSSLQVGMRRGDRWVDIKIFPSGWPQISRSDNGLIQKWTSKTVPTSEELQFLEQVRTRMNAPLYTQ